MDETFLNDYLEGKYPNYDSKLLANDLAFAIYSKLRGSRFCAISLTPKLYDSDIFLHLGEKLKSAFGHEVILKKDVRVGENDLWEAEFFENYDQSECDRFNLFLAEFNVICSSEDFRLIKLFCLYQKFKDH